MATFSDKSINQIVFNKVTQEQYEQMVEDGTINDNEFYITESEQNSENVYTKNDIDGKITTINESIDTKVNANDLATVATTGDYNDLLNIPSNNIDTELSETSTNTVQNKVVSESLNTKLNQNQISNCLLKNPKLVDVEITNSGETLVLKSGSTIIVPWGKSAPTMSIGDSWFGGTITDISWNGSLLFYYVTYSEDKTLTSTMGSDGVRVFYMGKTGGFNWNVVAGCYSGSTQPSSATGVWYDTETNFVKKSQSDSTWNTGYSLVFAKINTSMDLAFISFYEIYQSIGCFGSTAWVGKGVSGLIPDGLNDDGSYKNVLFTVDNINLRTYTGTSTLEQNLIINATGVNFVSKTAETYNLDKNFIYNGYTKRAVIIAGELKITSGKITSFVPNGAFKAVDYNDNDFINHVLPAGLINIYPSTTPPDGWLICNGNAISRFKYSRLFDVIGTTFGAGDGSTTFNLPDIQPLINQVAPVVANTSLSGADRYDIFKTTADVRIAIDPNDSSVLYTYTGSELSGNQGKLLPNMNADLSKTIVSNINYIIKY